MYLFSLSIVILFLFSLVLLYVYKVLLVCVTGYIHLLVRNKHQLVERANNLIHDVTGIKTMVFYNSSCMMLHNKINCH
jgi:hypothetical protein